MLILAHWSTLSIQVDVFDLQNKNEEEFAAMVGELVHRAWSHEEMSYVKGNRQKSMSPYLSNN